MRGGGVGGARMARGLAAVLDPDHLAIVVNVGDDDTLYGVEVSPDIDTVVATLAGIEGPHGWGRRDDSFAVMNELDRLGVDTKFRLGDTDLAACLERTISRASGEPLSEITLRIAHSLGVRHPVIPVTDDRLRTRIITTEGERLDFQDYFVARGHRDRVAALEFDGAADSKPAPGVVDAIAGADLVLIAPSNPPLSVWPMLAVPGIEETLRSATSVIGVSPLFEGKALKGPAADVLESLGFPAGNRGVVEAYRGLLDELVVDSGDAADAASLGAAVRVADTRIIDPDAAARFAREILEFQ